jgi:hypothetical protein
MGTSSQGVAASSPRGDHRAWWQSAAVAAQAGILFVTLMMGLGWGGILWILALAQAAAGLVLVGWLAVRRHGPALLAVPVVSLALTLGGGELSNSVSVACDDRVLEAFEQVPPPTGVPVEPFVSPSQGCMAETPPRPRGGESLDPYRSNVWADVFTHYRREFTNHGWRIVPDEGEGGLRAERDGMYVAMYRSEDRVYFILGER